MDRPPQPPRVPADAVPSTDDIRSVYLRRSRDTASSAAAAAPIPIKRSAVTVRLALFGIACAVLVGLSRYDLAPSTAAVSVTAYDTAVERLASTVSAALEFIGERPAGPVTNTDIALTSPRRVPSVTPAIAQRGPLDSSQDLRLLPLVSVETAQAIEPPKMSDADVSSQDDAHVDGTMIYSPEDAEVNPPVAIRSPGLGENVVHGVDSSSVIEIVVSETGLVESARGWQRPATLGAALESTTAVSVVKTWRFSPALRHGQPVKYRTTLPFAQTMNPAGTRAESR